MDALNSLLLLAADATEVSKSSSWLDELDKHSGAATVIATVALAVITLVYVLLTNGLLRAAKNERNHRNWLLRSEQARLVGGYIDRLPKKGGPSGDQPIPGVEVMKLTLVNASKLPVRKVIGTVYRKGTLERFDEFKEVTVLKPDAQAESESRSGWREVVGENTRAFEFAQEPADAEFELHLRFDDDAGLTWEKYASIEEPVRLVTVLNREGRWKRWRRRRGRPEWARPD
jgi:hypothetical protein